MAKKKKSESGKRIAKRVSEEAPTPKAQETSAPREPEPKASSVTDRIQEKDSGFGTIKVIVGVIVVLIIGAGLLGRYTGSEDLARGDLLPGERCESTQECAKGTICYSYKGEAKRCYHKCSLEDSTCEPGFTCTSSSYTAGRKKTKVRSICVEDSKL